MKDTDDTVGKLFNHLCKTVYGNHRWSDAEMEEADPVLYSMFMKYFKREEEESAKEYKHVLTDKDRLENSIYELETVASYDSEDLVDLEVEIWYEDVNGVEGCLTKQIQHICEDAVSCFKRELG